MQKPLYIAFYSTLLILTCLMTPIAKAQSELELEPTILSSEVPNLRFENIGISDGLKQHTITGIIQDRKGFIWIGTQQGLHRYDGHEFKVYQQTAFDTTSLSENWIRGLAEAQNGDIWMSTQDGGLNRLDQSSGTFKKYRHDPNDSTSISANMTNRPFVDSRGNLWVGSQNEGLNRMKKDQEGIFDRFAYDKDDPKSLSSNRVFFIQEDEEGYLWVGSSNGLNRIHPETDEITRYQHAPENRTPKNVILSMYMSPSRSGLFWLATAAGLMEFDTNTGDFSIYKVVPGQDGVFNRLNLMTEIVPDPNDPNILWTGGLGMGLARFDIRSKSFISYKHNPKDPNGLSDDFVSSLIIDRSGTIWAGTGSGGINTFNPGAINFTHLIHDPDNEGSIAPGTVFGVFEDSNEILWISSNYAWSGNILTEYDIKTGRSKRYEFNPNDPNSIAPGGYRKFMEGENNILWIASSAGLIKFDRTTKLSSSFRHEVKPENRGRNNMTNILRVTSSPHLFWIASFGGLDRFDTKTGEFEHIPLPSEELGLESDPYVLSLHQTETGELWVGTYQGLLHVSSSDEVSIMSTYNPEDTTGLNNPTIATIIQRDGDDDTVWLGTTSGGLNRFDVSTGTVTHITEKDGLANNTIYGLMVDKNNTLWMSTNGGISNYDPDNKTFRNYGLDDGLMALEYSQHAFSKSRNGVFYFGSSKGVTAFIPEQLQINETPPKIAFTDFKIFNVSVEVDQDSPLTQPLNETRHITLPYDQNEISFDYVALHFANPNKNTYSYQLKGFDTEWIDAGSKRTAAYTNLPEGDYTFHVRAANADGIWNNTGITMGITILPPWYRTWWAYGLFTLTLGFTVFGVDKVQRARISKKEEEKNALREAELKADAENKRRADSEQLSKIGRSITSSLSVDTIIETVYENVNELMNASIFSVGIFNEENQTLEFPSTKEKGVKLAPYALPLHEENRLAVHCFKKEEEIIIGDFPKEKSNYLKAYAGPVVGEDPMSIVYIPLILKNKVVGVITTQSFKKDAYTPYHTNLLRSLATYVAIALDNASAYKRLHATLNELQATQQQLVQQEKLASLGQLTAGIAHEIKNPLNFVNNFSELNNELIDEQLEEINKGDLEEIKELALIIRENSGKINHHGKRADAIVKGMLAHSRTGKGEKEPTDINQLADEYLRLSYHGLRAKDKKFNAEFKTNLDPDLPKVNVVPQDIGRVLLNLINNAFQASSSSENPLVQVGTKKTENEIEISVSDNGPGIPNDIKDKIFQPFFTTKKGTEGTGLGLSLSYDVVTIGHGGTLSVASQEGKGALFTVTLPLSYHEE